MQTIYIAQKNADTTEGRGPMINVCAFFTFEEAAKFVDDKPGVMGRREKWSEKKWGGDWKILPIAVFDNVAEYESEHQEELRQAALKKLTLEERRILGLDK